jgi:hypothetical protein
VVRIAIQGLIPAIKEKIGFDCPNLAGFARKIASIEAQFRYCTFQET